MRILRLSLLVCLAVGSLLQAQGTGAGIQGKIKDANAAAVVKAAVRVRNIATGGLWNATSDDSGRYRVPALPPGEYELSVQAAGFADLSRKGLILTVGQDVILDLMLETAKTASSPSGSEDSTILMTDAEALNLTSGAVTGTVNDRQIRDLPLNGRSFQQLAALQPGVTVAYSSGFDVTGRTPKLSINGARPEAVQFLLDGTNINNILGKVPGSVAGVLLGVDAVMEFRVMTNAYSAEYGRVGGGTVEAATRWGGNDLHGSAFEFLRNSRVDAKNYFDRPGEEIPPFKRNQFGGTLGGAIKKDRTFFFASYESLMERLGIPGLAFVPDDNARQGILNGQTIPVNPASAEYMKTLFPAANGPSVGNGSAIYYFSQSQPTDEHSFMGRLDHRLSNGDLLFGRYSFDNANIHRIPGDKPPVSNLHERSRNQYVTLEHQHLIVPSLLNSARIGFNRSVTESANDRTIDIPSSLSFVSGQPFGFLTVGGLVSDLGGDFRVPRSDRWNSYQAQDSMLFLKGAHAIRFGVQAERILINQFAVTYLGAGVRFANLEGFLRGTPLAADVAIPAGLLPNDRSSWDRSFRQSLVSGFIQDDARLRDNLAINLGLRYEVATVTTEKWGRITTLDNIDARQLTVGGDFYKNPGGTFAPRIGLAWDPFSQHTTAVRAGFGMFYDQITQKYNYYGGTTNAPFTVRTTIPNPAFPNVLSNVNLAAIKPTVQDFNGAPDNPYMMQFNLSVQQMLPGKWAVTAAYVGSRGIHLVRQANANLASYVLVDGVKNYQPQLGVRNPAFGAIVLRSTDARSYYNSLQMNAARQLGHGFRTQIAYTFSRSVDDASGMNQADFDSSVQMGIDQYDRLRDRGLSSFHAKHNLTMNWTADLPFGKNARGFSAALVKGWQLNNITTFQSGHPFTVNLGFNRSGNLNLAGISMNERPSLAPGYSNNPVTGNPARYFDVNAFVLPPSGQIGTLGRNTLIGPSLLMSDLSLVKPLVNRERTKLQFRAEAFNFLNHPNFKTPSGRTVFTNAAGAVAADAGRITSTVTSSRQIQAGLKLVF